MKGGARYSLLTILAILVSLSAPPAQAATLTISGTPWGKTTRYIGATEGGTGFDAADLRDLGVNTYRLWGGMSRWEPVDDDGVYGSPTIAQIKADPNIIPWKKWDATMNAPGWGGVSTKQLLEILKREKILPVVTIRNRDDKILPTWSPNPPRTPEDWNEWWEFTFATVYWMNVRNDLRVDDWEVHNEPDNRGQGWRGTKEDYFEFVRQTVDAIHYVYTKYLHNRPHRIYGPVTCYAQSWSDTFTKVGDILDGWDFHIYRDDFTRQTEFAHATLDTVGKSSLPLWVSEWGSYDAGAYREPVFANNTVIRQMMQGCRPGKHYVYGSHIFSMYGWEEGPLNDTGIIAADGKTPSYYAMRMALRALQGARPTYETISSDDSVIAITTKQEKNQFDLLVNNTSALDVPIEADLSVHADTGKATQWQLDATHYDVLVGRPAFSDGHLSFTVPANGSVLLRFSGRFTTKQ